MSVWKNRCHFLGKNIKFEAVVYNEAFYGLRTFGCLAEFLPQVFFSDA